MLTSKIQIAAFDPRVLQKKRDSKTELLSVHGPANLDRPSSSITIDKYV